MTICRLAPRTKFTMVPNHVLEDTRLQWQDKGILSYLLSKPDNWEVCNQDIANRGLGGIAQIKASMARLKACGYIRKVRVTDEQGKVVRWETYVYDTPEVENRPSGFPESKNQNQEKPEGRKSTTNKTKRNNKTLNKQDWNNNARAHEEFQDPKPPDPDPAETPLDYEPTLSTTPCQEINSLDLKIVPRGQPGLVPTTDNIQQQWQIIADDWNKLKLEKCKSASIAPGWDMIGWLKDAIAQSGGFEEFRALHRGGLAQFKLSADKFQRGQTYGLDWWLNPRWNNWATWAATAQSNGCNADAVSAAVDRGVGEAELKVLANPLAQRIRRWHEQERQKEQELARREGRA